MQQFFTSERVAVGEEILLPEYAQFQLLRVLRAREGDEVRLVDASKRAFLVTLRVMKKEVRGWVQSMIEEHRELPGRLVVALAQIKKTPWEWALQKVTELGATDIILLQTDYAQNKLRIDAHYIERIQAILREAAEQSERHVIPQFLGSYRLDQIQDLSIDHWYSLLEREEKHDVFSVVRRSYESHLSEEKKTASIGLLIGPEGGWSPAEKEWLKVNTTGISLGPRILRAETAAVLGCGLLAQTLEAMTK